MILPQSNPTWSHDSPFKGSRSFHHPKKVTIAELPGTFQIFRYVKLTKLKHHKKKSTSPFQLHLQQGSLDYIILLILILVEIKKCSKKKDMYIYRPRQKNWGFISPQQKKPPYLLGLLPCYISSFVTPAKTHHETVLAFPEVLASAMWMAFVNLSPVGGGKIFGLGRTD